MTWGDEGGTTEGTLMGGLGKKKAGVRWGRRLPDRDCQDQKPELMIPAPALGSGQRPDIRPGGVEGFRVRGAIQVLYKI
jgi:hypothetical protein